jgi:integrase
MTNKVGLYRSEQEGTVKWRVRWFGKYDPKTGRQKRYSKTFNKKKEAEHFQEQRKKELGQGVRRDPSKETLKEYAGHWLYNKTINENLRPATVILYELTLNRLYDYFGENMMMRRIDRRAAKSFLAELKPITENQTSLGNWSRHRVLRQSKTLFKEAVRDGVLGINPFDEINPPKCTPSEWYYLKSDGFLKLLEVTPKLKEKVLYTLAYTAGLRETEALALYWTDIDFETGKVHITNRAATKEYPPFDIKDTDVRTIPLPKMTLNLLAQLHEEAPEKVPFVLMDKQDCQRIRDKWEKCQKEGRPWLNRYWSNNVIRNFHRRVKWAGIEPGNKELTVHVLRKCCGQNWANTLPMNVVKEFMGHSSIDTTEKFYSTVDNDHFEKAKETMNDLLEKAGAEKTDLLLTFSGDSEKNQSEAEKSSCDKSLNSLELEN